ncbi:hypothetical protein [Pseudomonas sp.]|uniref:hypothetical protein n=1 Tax=Pseudomonas sp. TaxID=306 RepID=UPI00258CB2D3|nr:hypothetical protein [Pseudomonas sp.]
MKVQEVRDRVLDEVKLHRFGIAKTLWQELERGDAGVDKKAFIDHLDTVSARLGLLSKGSCVASNPQPRIPRKRHESELTHCTEYGFKPCATRMKD